MEILCVYTVTLHTPFDHSYKVHLKVARLTQDEQEWKQRYEWCESLSRMGFLETLSIIFKFLDFEKNLKIQLSAVGKMYIVCTLLHNARCCLYGSTTSQYFEIEPPSLTEYFL